MILSICVGWAYGRLWMTIANKTSFSYGEGWVLVPSFICPNVGESENAAEHFAS